MNCWACPSSIKGRGFAMLPLRDGVMLGLWGRETVEPKSSGQSGASEIAFAVTDADAVETMYVDWKRRGLKILQAPTRMSFGMTFVALDPDGHRLRVFAPGAALKSDCRQRAEPGSAAR